VSGYDFAASDKLAEINQLCSVFSWLFVMWMWSC